MARIADQVLASFQSNNPEQFEEGIVNWRKTDRIEDYIRDIFRALEIIPGIKLRDLTIEHDETKISRTLLGNEVSPTRVDLVTGYFDLRLEHDGNPPTIEESQVEVPILIPKVINDTYFHINGVTFYPILQLVDRGIYTTARSLTLKTLLMPLTFDLKTMGNFKVKDEDELYHARVFTLNLFKTGKNALHYFLGKFGIKGTLEFLEINDKIRFHIPEGTKDAWPVIDEENEVGVFIDNKQKAKLIVDREFFNTAFGRNIVATFCDQFKRTPLKAIKEDNLDYWMFQLNSTTTGNAATKRLRALKVLMSFERILDDRTKFNLAHLEQKDKEDIYSIVRWMMRDFESLKLIDNMDVTTKRLRLSEWIINPLLLKLSKGTYRLLNSGKPNLKKIEAVLAGAKPGIIMTALSKSNMIRFSNHTNPLSLWVSLAYSLRGPQSPSGGSGKGSGLPLKARGHAPSYVGRIGLNSASVSDPGSSGTLTPFVKTQGQFIK